VERGKPVFPPARAGKPQGALWGVLVWDGGEIESPSVMAGIGVEPQGDIMGLYAQVRPESRMYFCFTG
jgi:hypothetical protein